MLTEAFSARRIIEPSDSTSASSNVDATWPAGVGGRGRMTSVLLVDDHEMVRAGLRIILGTEEDLDVVAEAVDGAAVVEAARVYKPDVVLMDIQMPGVDGIEATRRIVASMPGVRW